MHTSSGQTVETGDGQIVTFHDQGEGAAVLLIHGGVFADWFVPVAAEPALADQRVVRVRESSYFFTDEVAAVASSPFGPKTPRASPARRWCWWAAPARHLSTMSPYASPAGCRWRPWRRWPVPTTCSRSVNPLC